MNGMGNPRGKVPKVLLDKTKDAGISGQPGSFAALAAVGATWVTYLERTKSTGLEVFRKAVHNVRPLLEVKARRVGGATYQVPTEVREARSVALAMRWLITYASDRKDKSMSQKFAAEFIAASNGEGSSIKKKEDTHKMAEANKAFAHYRW